MTLKHHDERERLLVKVHHAADADDVREDDDALKTTKTTTRSSWMKSSTLATIASLLICCAFVAMTASSSESSSLGVSKFRNKGGLLNVYGSKEAGESTASRAKFSATTNTEEESVTQLAQLGYADVDLDTAALGAKERNMIQASLAIEDVQRKIKRLERRSGNAL